MFFIVTQFLAMTLIAVVFIYKPSIPIVIDHASGDIIGDYRTSELRTQSELINGGMRFVDHLLSLNSSTIRRDQFIAINMMAENLKVARIKYLTDTNLVPQIEKAKSSSHLDYDSTEVIFIKADRLRVEFRGDIILTNLQKTSVPFHIIVDLISAPITTNNTTGVKVESYNDF
ncbi:MAG: hypothetical protein GY820_43470 [Gammaproteobacteria bacterium]|nr:hypothetical protein [Gammaproteobacteria bacterium]